MKLSVPLIRQIHDRLQRRHLAKGDKGLLAVGIGWAMKNGGPDPERGLVIKYAVRRKKKNGRILPAHRIPRQVAVYLTRGRRKKRYRAVFSTDVVEIGQAVESGSKAYSGTNGEQFTVGALIKWGPSANPSWGLLTVGHAIDNPKDVISINMDNSPPIIGSVVAHTSSSDTLDAALILLNASDVQTSLGQILPAPGAALPVARSVDELIQDADQPQTVGFTRTPNGPPMSFIIEAFYPNPANPIFPQSPNRTDILKVGGQNLEFDYGTSGSAWVGAAPFVDAIQIGATEPEMAVGFGQPIAMYLDWAQALPAVAGSKVQLIATF